MIKIKSISSAQTQKIAKLLAQEIIKKRIFKSALVISLKGNLGAGKTTFIQGFLRGLGVRKKITSPTFVLIKNYKLPFANYKNAYHIDCYRIKSAKEFSNLGIREIILNPKNIILIEWPERINKILPKDKIQIIFQHGEKEKERYLTIK